MENNKEQLLKEDAWIGCHDCDLLNEIEALPEDCEAHCSRCKALLFRSRSNSISDSLALSLAGLILFIPANIYPIMSLQVLGQSKSGTLLAGAVKLYTGGLEMVGVLILLTSIVIPLFKLLMLLYVLLPLQLGVRLLGMVPTFRIFQKLNAWGMLEVYMLGILVAIIKLGDLATVIAGTGLYAFVALLLVTVCLSAALDERVVWQRLEAMNA